MDDTLTLILLGFILAAVLVLMFMYLHLKARQRQSMVNIPVAVESAYGVKEAAFEPTPRFARANPENRQDIDTCLDRIFTKTVVHGHYSGVKVDDIPSVVLHLLDKIIDQNAYIKHTHNIIGKIDALENNMEELVTLVATDPLLSATVLRQANSSFYGARSDVSSLKFAIELIGLSNLKNLVYREYVLREHKGKPIADPALFALTWEHALLCATTAAYLAPAFPGTDPAQAYTVALLHDIGKFLLMSSGLVELETDRCVRPYHGSFSQDTALVWRYDHALAGKIAALKWEFGPEVANAIGMHHYPELVNIHHIKADNSLLQTLALVHVANQTAKFFSREPRAAAYVAPLHFSFQRFVDKGAIRAIMSGSNMIEELAKIKASMAFQE